jgi:hypothetical protein
LRIHRSHPDENFTILPNATLRDCRLSYTARGVLIELLSHLDGWETNADALWRLAQRERGGKTGEGRRAIRAAFAELEECGYMVRRRSQKEKGRFVTEIDLYDTPDHRSAATGTSAWDEVDALRAINGGDRGAGYETSVGETSADETSVTGTSTRSTNLRSTNERTTNEEDSSTLAEARVAALAARKKSQLHELYTAVNRIADQDLRNALLKFEQRRPRIYRECRNSAIDQIGGDDPRALKGESAAREIDTLSYKYALRHYHDTADEWPAWLVRPLLAAGGQAA